MGALGAVVHPVSVSEAEETEGMSVQRGSLLPHLAHLLKQPFSFPIDGEEGEWIFPSQGEKKERKSAISSQCPPNIPEAVCPKEEGLKLVHQLRLKDSTDQHSSQKRTGRRFHTSPQACVVGLLYMPRGEWV